VRAYSNVGHNKYDTTVQYKSCVTPIHDDQIIALGDVMPITTFEFVKEMQYVKDRSGYHITNVQACDPHMLLQVIKPSDSLLHNHLPVARNRHETSRLDRMYTRICVLERLSLMSPWRMQLV